MPDEAVEVVLDDLGDRTRRRVLELLRTGERSVAELTGDLPVSQSAVSQHLRVLKDAGLVTDRAVGTRRYYSVRPDGLAGLRYYLDGYWDGVLASFSAFVSNGVAAPSAPQGPASPVPVPVPVPAAQSEVLDDPNPARPGDLS